MKPLTEDALSLPGPTREVAAILLTCVVSLVLPIQGGVIGYLYFFCGFFFLAGCGFPWLANPLLWFGVWRLWRRDNETALILGIAATLMAAAFLLLDRNVLPVGPAYWTWLLSCALLPAIALYHLSNTSARDCLAQERWQRATVTDEPDTAFMAGRVHDHRRD